jgi:hypothetical protein
MLSFMENVGLLRPGTCRQLLEVMESADVFI